MPVPFEPSFISLTVRSLYVSDTVGEAPATNRCDINTTFSPVEAGSQVIVSQSIKVVSGETEKPVIELHLDAKFDIPNRSLHWTSTGARILLKTILSGLLASTARGLLAGAISKSA